MVVGAREARFGGLEREDLSRPFIERPVATALLTVALLLSEPARRCALLPVSRRCRRSSTRSSRSPRSSLARAGHHRAHRHRAARSPARAGARAVRMSSSSSSGASVITLQFALEVDLGVAEQEVQAALTTAAGLLPPRPAVPARLPQGQPGRGAHRHARHHLGHVAACPRCTTSSTPAWRRRSARLPGVGLVPSLAGGQRPALRVRVLPDCWPSHGLDDGGRAQGGPRPTSTVPRASFDGPVRMTMLDANDQIRSAADYRALIVA